VGGLVMGIKRLDNPKNQKVIKFSIVLFVLILVVIIGIFFFFYQMYHKDMKKLTDFVASYEKFDQAISDFSINKTDDLEGKTSNVLLELKTKATFRISSLIRNEGEAMKLALEIADLSEKEFDSLKAYKEAIQNKNASLDRFSKQYDDLANNRKSAYARFQELARE
jgi:hypothetical protein